MHEGDTVAMRCRFTGVPKPSISWHYRYSYGEVCSKEKAEYNNDKRLMQHTVVLFRFRMLDAIPWKKHRKVREGYLMLRYALSYNACSF